MFGGYLFRLSVSTKTILSVPFPGQSVSTKTILGIPLTDSWSIHFHKTCLGYSIFWLLVYPFPQKQSWVFHLLTPCPSISTKMVLDIWPYPDSWSIRFHKNGVGYSAMSRLLVHLFSIYQDTIHGSLSLKININPHFYVGWLFFAWLIKLFSVS